MNQLKKKEKKRHAWLGILTGRLFLLSKICLCLVGLHVAPWNGNPFNVKNKWCCSPSLRPMSVFHSIHNNTSTKHFKTNNLLDCWLVKLHALNLSQLLPSFYSSNKTILKRKKNEDYISHQHKSYSLKFCLHILYSSWSLNEVVLEIQVHKNKIKLFIYKKTEVDMPYIYMHTQ